MSIKLSEVPEQLKQLLAEHKQDGIINEPIALEVEESDGVIVDYTITKHGSGYDVCFDDRDLTLGLDMQQFASAEELLEYFEQGKREPLILDSVDS